MKLANLPPCDSDLHTWLRTQKKLLRSNGPQVTLVQPLLSQVMLISSFHLLRPRALASSLTFIVTPHIQSISKSCWLCLLSEYIQEKKNVFIYLGFITFADTLPQSFFYQAGRVILLKFKSNHFIPLLPNLLWLPLSE